MRVQDLECPVAPRMSAHVDAAHRWSTSWMRRCGLLLDDDALRRVEAAGFARYAARLYPGANAADLGVLTGLITWFFLLDDGCDAVRDPNPGRLRTYLSGVVECLENPRAGAGIFAGPMRAMLADAWRWLRERMPAVWLERFTMHVQEYVNGVLAEAANKAAGWRPGLAGYVRLRRATSGAYVCQTLTEFATGAVVPDPIYHHPAVRAYSEAGNDLLSWFNDLVSLHDDLDTGGGHNLVLALAADRKLALVEATHEAAAMWRRTERDFAALRARVPSFGPAMNSSVRRYLDGVATSVRATLDWSAESGRYPAGVPAHLRLALQA